QDRSGKVEVVWVRGHSNNEGNNMADAVATTAVREDTVPWRVDLGAQQDISHFAYFQGTLVETDLRQLLKQQTTIRHHQAWTAQRRTKYALRDLDEIEWRSTLAHIHNKRQVHTFYSSAKDTHQRSHRIKKMYGMLPTLNSMRARHPNLYEDHVCCVCDVQDEDNHHVWICHKTDAAQKSMWKDALSRIDRWGRQATSKYNKEHEDDDGYQPVRWVCPANSVHVQADAVSVLSRPEKNSRDLWNCGALEEHHPGPGDASSGSINAAERLQQARRL
ncbi:hypothetical protein BGX28_003206, partial [Mortierella sp. GBA30]